MDSEQDLSKYGVRFDIPDSGETSNWVSAEFFCADRTGFFLNTWLIRVTGTMYFVYQRQDFCGKR